jgi:hypothetical protein
VRYDVEGGGAGEVDAERRVWTDREWVEVDPTTHVRVLFLLPLSLLAITLPFTSAPLLSSASSFTTDTCACRIRATDECWEIAQRACITVGSGASRGGWRTKG